MEQERLQRRVAGWHDIRLDGLTDLLLRTAGCSVLDVGCNRGMVGLEFFCNGAVRVDGCDNYVEGIATARHVFIDRRNCESQFEVVDLTQGFLALTPFGGRSWDIVVMLATYHKLKRIMPAATLELLMEELGRRSKKFFAWRGTSEKHDENFAEMKALDTVLRRVGLERVHTSQISLELGLAAIWRRE